MSWEYVIQKPGTKLNNINSLPSIAPWNLHMDHQRQDERNSAAAELNHPWVGRKPGGQNLKATACIVS